MKVLLTAVTRLLVARSSCTKAALAGGVTLIGAMPNTHPSITNREALDLVQQVGVRNTSGCVLVCRGCS